MLFNTFENQHDYLIEKLISTKDAFYYKLVQELISELSSITNEYANFKKTIHYDFTGLTEKVKNNTVRIRNMADELSRLTSKNNGSNNSYKDIDYIESIDEDYPDSVRDYFDNDYDYENWLDDLDD